MVRPGVVPGHVAAGYILNPLSLFASIFLKLISSHTANHLLYLRTSQASTSDDSFAKTIIYRIHRRENLVIDGVLR